MSIIPPSPAAKRKGCAGGCLLNIAKGLGFALVVVYAVYVITSPWVFYMGGRFHPFAYWQGWGTIHAPEGDYVVLMLLTAPRRYRGSGMYLSGPSIGGSGAVCSPHGELYDSLRVSGTFVRKGIGTNTDGEPVSLGLAQRLNFLGSNGSTRLDLSFRGAWKNPDLVLEDTGSIERVFLPNGERYQSGGAQKRRASPESLKLTLHEGSRSEFKAACAMAARSSGR
jgi:uncharacterized membrane protein YqaE (UPF0057 family)